MKRCGRLLTVLMLLAGALIWSGLPSVADEAESLPVGVEVGMKAPDFTLPVLDGEGDTVTLYEQVEQYDAIILYFFYAAT